MALRGWCGIFAFVEPLLRAAGATASIVICGLTGYLSAHVSDVRGPYLDAVLKIFLLHSTQQHPEAGQTMRKVTDSLSAAATCPGYH